MFKKKFLEKDLEDYIFSFSDKQLFEKGLMFNGKLKRQFKIPNYGIADLIAFEKNYDDRFDRVKPYYTITVIELKKDVIGISAYLQAIKYCNGIKEFLWNRNFYMFDFEIILVGSKLDRSGSFKYISSLSGPWMSFGFGAVKNVAFYEYEFSKDGIIFNFC